MQAYVSAEMYDLDVWNVLETLLLEQIASSSAPVLVESFVAHTELTRSILTSKGQPKGLVKHFKAYNEEFLTHVLAEITTRIKSDQLNLKGVLQVILHANIAHLKKRDNIRQAHKLTLAGIEVLFREAEMIENKIDREHLLVQYYTKSLVFCLNQDKVEELNSRFRDHGLEIE